ncbi:hypothetical protein Syun_029796 [Stephania yunnanensis]|uniref:Uncharacterized protein n=1 Tax=Stephania yunnanensis TaxID=152371 RepID=A0AAP0HJV8_9MAGN
MFPENDPVYGHMDETSLDFMAIDIRLPLFVYVTREKRPGYDHNKKAGAMNAMVRASAILSNSPFILNFDCDHYIYNSLALREGMCFMMDRGGDRICYIQFPQCFEGIDPSDRYANHNIVFFDGNMRALDGLQGPVYVGTGCLFRRFALYGFHPPRANEYAGLFGQIKYPAPHIQAQSDDDEEQPLNIHPTLTCLKMKNGQPPGTLLAPRPPLDAPTIVETVAVIACWIGWIYGSVTEDVVTGYQVHNRGWRSVYCITKQDAFRGTAPINLTDRLHQVLRWATGSVEIFFSRNNPFLATTLKWSGIALEEWWRNEQFWVIGGSSAHLVAVLQGLLKAIAGIEISFTLTSKSTAEDEDDIYADLYVVKWTSLFIVPLTIMVINVVALVLGFSRIVYSVIPQWNKFFGGAFFSFWVLTHLYPFAKGLLGRKGKLPTIVYLWTGASPLVVSFAAKIPLWLKIMLNKAIKGDQAGTFETSTFKKGEAFQDFTSAFKLNVPLKSINEALTWAQDTTVCLVRAKARPCSCQGYALLVPEEPAKARPYLCQGAALLVPKESFKVWPCSYQRNLPRRDLVHAKARPCSCQRNLPNGGLAHAKGTCQGAALLVLRESAKEHGVTVPRDVGTRHYDVAHGVKVPEVANTWG